MEEELRELREAAEGYYNNASKEHQLVAWNFFKSMDTDGDEKVSLNEYAEFIQQQGYDSIHPDLFPKLDRNGDGCLDFREVLTLYYMVKAKSVSCRNCRAVLKGLYFTCVECFDGAGDTYDLCLTCYRRQNFSHDHSRFCDSHVLLRSKRQNSTTGRTKLNLAQPSNPLHLVVAPDNSKAQLSNPQQAQPSNPQQLAVVAPRNSERTWSVAFKALETLVAISSLAAGCTVM